MWAERWIEAVPEIKFLQSNTDGQTILCPRSKLNLIRKVNDQLTKENGLPSNTVINAKFHISSIKIFYKKYFCGFNQKDNNSSQYSKMVIRDVNNYISVYEDSIPSDEHLKLKGCFEIDKEFYKDPSMKIVQIALKEYFVNNIPIKETILNHTNIYDFCLRLKTNSKSTPIFRHFDENKK